MAKEIERKFLVLNDDWRKTAEKGKSFRQGYIATSDGRSLRVRLIDGKKARLTIKIGAGTITRDEFEYDIPYKDGRELMANAIGNVLEKTRYEVRHKGFTWEIDVFSGAYDGLVVAEVELDSEKQIPSFPSWLGREVTGDQRYSNQSLALGGSLEELPDELSNTA